MNKPGREHGGARTNETAPLPLSQAKTLLSRSRILGRVSACIFILAVLAVLDGLQTLMRHEFNSIAIIPGEQIFISGMLPGKASSHKDLVVFIEGDADISFTPVETYKGFWMGGQMWRAELKVPPDALPGAATIVIEDILPPDKKAVNIYAGQQNPALVFSVTLYPSFKELRAADNSLFRRYTGFPAFGVAAGMVLCAILAGIGNWFFFNRAESALALHGIFFIHGVKVLQKGDASSLWPESGYKIAFAHAGQKFLRHEPMRLLDPEWQEQGSGMVVEVTRIKAFALCPPDGVAPRYGWLVARTGAA